MGWNESAPIVKQKQMFFKKEIQFKYLGTKPFPSAEFKEKWFFDAKSIGPFLGTLPLKNPLSS